VTERPILVTGAAGAVGRAVVARAHDIAVVGLTRDELDITDVEAVALAFERLRPQVVINAAACTAVDAAERDSTPAYRVNAAGAANLARACAAHDAWLVHLSTDCVFGEGIAGRPHREDDTPSPLNAYGRSKYLGELAVAAALPAHVILRTSWVFGAGLPGFVNAVARALLREGRAEVVTGQVGCPTPVAALAAAIHACAARATAGTLAPGIYHFCSPEPVDRYALAGWMADWLSHRTGRPPGTLVPRDWRDRDLARRAANAAMSVEKFERATGINAPEWQPAVAELLEEMVLASESPARTAP